MKDEYRFIVEFDAVFGVDPTDPYDKDDNAYVPGGRDRNILDAITAGRVAAGQRCYIEIGGDVVCGELVAAPAVDAEREWKVEITHKGSGRTTFAPTFACYDEDRARRSAVAYLNDPNYTVVVRSRPVGAWVEEPAPAGDLQVVHTESTEES